MGRPPVSQERRIATAVRLPESLHRRLQDAARDRQVSVNLLVTTAVTNYLASLPSAAEALASELSTPEAGTR